MGERGEVEISRVSSGGKSCACEGGVCVPGCGAVPRRGKGDQVELVDSKEVLLHGEARAGRAGCHGDIFPQNRLAGSLHTHTQSQLNI